MTRPKLLITHPFDEAVALDALVASADEHGRASARQFEGRPHPAYANMVGPFGGVTAAQALAAVLAHPERLGEPVALTVNFAAALADAPFRVEARPARTNRSTQHWTVTMTQTGADGVDAVMLTASAVTALGATPGTRSTHPCPPSPRPPTCRARPSPTAWPGSAATTCAPWPAPFRSTGTAPRPTA